MNINYNLYTCYTVVSFIKEIISSNILRKFVQKLFKATVRKEYHDIPFKFRILLTK